jgi:LysM repeat protein
MTRKRLATLGIFLLVSVIVVAGVGACARSAEERETSGTEAEGTAVSSGPSSGEGETPAPGETVVSAVTTQPQEPGSGVQATPVTGTQATPVESSGTPVASQPTSTPEPGATEAPPAAPPPSSSGQAITHTVRPGDTVYSIARRYGTSVQAISQANNLVNPSQIYVGQKLTIPTSGGSSSVPSGGTTGCRVRHTVKRGEWIWQIGRNYGVSPYDIMAANGLSIQTSTIHAGQTLCIP